MCRKLFKNVIQYIDNEIPRSILISIITLLSTTIAYICGQLFIMHYFFKGNFTFLDIIINPLPIAYGHILFIGGILIVGCICLIAILTTILVKWKHRYSHLILMIICFIFLNYIIVMIFTNGNQLINTAIFCIYILTIFGAIYFFIDFMTNFKFGLSVFAIWFITVLIIDIFSLSDWHHFIETFRNILTIPFFSFFIIYTISRCIVWKIGKPKLKNFEYIYKEVNSVFKDLSFKLKGVIISMVSIGLVILAFTIFIGLLPLINDWTISDRDFDQISVNGNTSKEIYIGVKEGTHYYINEENKLIQTNSEIIVSPIDND
ncbi:hypothetical protein [Oceanobacillus sojae]|uniref:hypothetical protein n=1 Tax=Oceanobacillus sojae TaxID=582851 RepID=UPI003626699E